MQAWVEGLSLLSGRGDVREASPGGGAEGPADAEVCGFHLGNVTGVARQRGVVGVAPSVCAKRMVWLK